MRVLVAPDKFAGTLTAAEAAAAMGRGWRVTRPDDAVDLAPMADGGPGFLGVLRSALGGHVLRVGSTGPLGRPLVADVLVVSEAQVSTAYVEAASVCGLPAATQSRRPMEASTEGLVAVLRAAADAVGRAGPDVEVRRVVVGVGGTASTDGGRPVVEALTTGWPTGVDLVAAVDVGCPLLGPSGAARTFGPQKGATPAEVERLEERLANWAATTGADPCVPGVGAGGGLGFGLALLGARLQRGAAVVAAAVHLRERVGAADLVLTGEGRLDETTWAGKVVAEVASTARDHQTPCWALVGQCTLDDLDAAGHGLSRVWSLSEQVGPGPATAEPLGSLSTLASRAGASWLNRPSWPSHDPDHQAPRE